MTIKSYPNDKKIAELEKIAISMVASGKGILAADESSPTIKKRFDQIQLESTADNRQFYRELLFTTPQIENHISGVILFDETLRQVDSSGTPFPQLLDGRGIIPGIKVDLGLTDIPGTHGEKATRGLDGLEDRLAEYRTLGAKFAKWRAVIQIGPHQPSSLAVSINAHSLARYAAITQEKGLVPIVEPEILMTGDHTLDACERVAKHTLEHVFAQLSKHRVTLEAMILKPSMITPGDKCPEQVNVEAVARSTIKIFKQTVPAAVPGIAFLSGGQSSELATAHLNAMNRLGRCPWELSFSYGRALQEKSLSAWSGKPENKQKAQDALLNRARCNGAARFGEYSIEMENALP